MSVEDVVEAAASPITGKLKMIKWAIIGGGALALVLLGWYFWTDYKSTKEALVKANAEVVLRTAENKDLKTTIDKKVDSDKINEKTQLDVVKGVQAVEKSTAAITTEHITKVKEIEQKYEQMPKTEANEKAKADEISADRLSRLWEVFCLANPQEARCLPYSAASAASK